jgi:4-hydroxybenzoate polyprenyltransferase
MNMEWISEKGASLTAFAIGLGFIGLSFLYGKYRYFLLCAAIVALIYGYKQFKKRGTPFERRERELRRKRL